MNRLRPLLIALAQAGMRALLRALSVVVRPTAQVVVSGFPATEGNAVEVTRALLRRYPGRVVWLAEGPPPVAVARLVEHGLVVLPKAGVRGFLAWLRAEAVFFTHGLYGSPRPSGARTVVNLWHGDGPKDIRPAPGVGMQISSTCLVASTRLFGEFQARAFGLAPDRLLVTGNPRTDEFWRPVPAEALARLGITGDFVVWLPTFRAARAVGAVRDVGVAPAATSSADPAPLLEGLRARGLQLVVKPHPMDADRRAVTGAVVLDDDALAAVGIGLSGLLGAARGLVTDYSSAWVDYLLLDRPICFWVPDRDSYSRALHPADILDWVPGEVVERSAEPFGEFFADLDAGGALGASGRAAVARRIGLNPTHTAAEDLLEALAERGVLALRASDRLDPSPPARGVRSVQRA